MIIEKQQVEKVKTTPLERARTVLREGLRRGGWIVTDREVDAAAVKVLRGIDERRREAR